jgi:hypothetical protein
LFGRHVCSCRLTGVRERARNERANVPRSLEEHPQVPLAVVTLHSTNLLTGLDANGTIRYESPSRERRRRRSLRVHERRISPE